MYTEVLLLLFSLTLNTFGRFVRSMLLPVYVRCRVCVQTHGTNPTKSTTSCEWSDCSQWLVCRLNFGIETPIQFNCEASHIWARQKQKKNRTFEPRSDIEYSPKYNTTDQTYTIDWYQQRCFCCCCFFLDFSIQQSKSSLLCYAFRFGAKLRRTFREWYRGNRKSKQQWRQRR